MLGQSGYLHSPPIDDARRGPNLASGVPILLWALQWSQIATLAGFKR